VGCLVVNDYCGTSLNIVIINERVWLYFLEYR
jgi:hypothetical protein